MKDHRMHCFRIQILKCGYWIYFDTEFCTEQEVKAKIANWQAVNPNTKFRYERIDKDEI